MHKSAISIKINIYDNIPIKHNRFFVALADKNGQRLADKLLKTQVVAI